MSLIRVLYVDHAPVMGGAEHSLLYLMKGLDRSRFDPVLACPPDSPLAPEAQAAGIAVAEAPLPRLKGNLWRAPFLYIWGVWHLLRVIRRWRIDIVHANVVRAAVYGAAAARLTRRPLVWHARDVHGGGAFAHAMGTLSDAIVAISEAVRQGIPRRYWPKTRLIYNGIDLSEFDVEAADRGILRRELGLPEDALLVGNVGWFAPWKGQRLFLETAAEVASEKPKPYFVLVGDVADPTYHRYGQDLLAFGREQLGDRFFWLGARHDMPQVMASLDVLVHTAEAEPLGRVLIEAQAMEVPVVAVDSGGVSEVVEGGGGGVLVPSRDASLLAKAVAELLSSPARRRQMGTNGRLRVRERFDLRSTAEQVESIYLALVSGRHG